MVKPKYKEKNLTADFSLWMRKSPHRNHLQHLFAVEFKLKYNKERLHLIRDFQAHQIPKLLQALNDCVYHKFSDMSLGLKPFDAVNICVCPAFVGVMWYKLRQPKILYLIDVREIQKLIEKEEFLLDEKTAKEIAVYELELLRKY